jgi:hypothetical protein
MSIFILIMCIIVLVCINLDQQRFYVDFYVFKCFSHTWFKVVGEGCNKLPLNYIGDFLH